MRKLIFVFALFCCSTQAMAQCAMDISNLCLKIPWGSVTREIGPIDFLNSIPLVFQASDTFMPGASHVQGVCATNKIGFDVFVFGNIMQSFSGTLTPGKNGSPITVSKGTFTSGKLKGLAWTAKVTSCSSSQSSLSPACVQCGKDQNACIATAAPNEKPGCIAEYKQCKAENGCK